MQPTPLDGLRTLAVNVMINIFPNSDVGPLLAPTVGKQPSPRITAYCNATNWKIQIKKLKKLFKKLLLSQSW